VVLQTHGCRLNQSETDAMSEALERAGHEVVQDVGGADVFVLNTCTITHGADADARQVLRRVARQHPTVRVVATGCLANRLGDELAELEGVSQVFGNLEKDDVVERVTGTELVQISALGQRRGRARPRPWSLPAAVRPRRARAFLKIQDGCNYRCSFCIVPEVRGGSRSLAPETLVSQLAAQAAAGCPEVVLTGVHLGTYGWDRGDRRGLSRLVDSLLSIPAATRLRLGSIDPHEVGEDLIDLFRRHTRLCRHLHLPVQSGSDSVLKRMRRAHDAASIRALLPRLRGEFEDMALGSDIIVGFPGETDDDFQSSEALMSDEGLDYAHVFSYSKRAGTAAATMPDAVDSATKKRRSVHLRQRSQARWRLFEDRHLGQTRPGVVLLSRSPGEGKLQVVTDNYLRVLCDGPDTLRGRAVRIYADRRERGRLVGTLVDA